MPAKPHITEQNSAEIAAKSLEVRRQMGPTPFAQAVEMQEIAMRDCRDDETAPHIRAALMRAWCDLEERKRILRMKPKPKDIDVTPKRRSHPKGAPTFLELPKPADPKAGAA